MIHDRYRMRHRQADLLGELLGPEAVEAQFVDTSHGDDGSAGLSRSMPAMASSTSWPMVLRRDCALRCAQRASGGAQKMLWARHSSGSSG
jgi:hypothetical protein